MTEPQITIRPHELTPAEQIAHWLESAGHAYSRHPDDRQFITDSALSLKRAKLLAQNGLKTTDPEVIAIDNLISNSRYSSDLRHLSETMLKALKDPNTPDILSHFETLVNPPKITVRRRTS